MHDGDTMLFHTTLEGGSGYLAKLRKISQSCPTRKTPVITNQWSSDIPEPMDIDEQIFHESKQVQLE